jgi:predicted secreted protein
MKNNLRQIELILYRLKREYGLPIVVRKQTQNDNDIQTGKITSAYDVYKIKRAICLPADLMRTFIYDLTYVAANKNFAYGGHFDKLTKVFIIDKKDIKVDGVKVAIGLDCHIVYKERRYDIVAADETEDETSYLIKAKNVDQTPIILDP